MRIAGAIIAAFVFVGSAATFASEPAMPNAEVEQLLLVLGKSQCQFHRNGTWYDGPEARAHLQKKYEYLRKKGLAETAEQFIANGGTKSSQSGEPYEVRCGAAAAEPSAQWLTGQLRQIRAAQTGSRKQ